MGDDGDLGRFAEHQNRWIQEQNEWACNDEQHRCAGLAGILLHLAPPAGCLAQLRQRCQVARVLARDETSAHCAPQK